jgi:hypothetical protein
VHELGEQLLHVEKIQNSNKILTGKAEGKRSFRSHKHKGGLILQCFLNEYNVIFRVDSSGSR